VSDLRTVGLTKRYPRADGNAVDGLALTVEHGEVVAVLGESGCGKTTLLRLIAGLETPTAGTIEIGGRVVVDRRRIVPPERRGVGMVFQDGALFPHLRVEDNVAFGLHGRRPADRRERARAMLELVGLGGLERRYPHELSGGQQQRVALARALAPEPTLLLLDEPFSSLDVVLKAQVRDEVADIVRRAGTTALFVLHDAEDALSISDRVLVLRDGVLQQDGPPSAVYAQPSNEYVARFFGRINVLPGVPCAGGYRTPVGLVAVPDSNCARCGVMLSIRPENLELVAEPAAGVPGVVRRVRYFGSHCELLVEVTGDDVPRDVLVHAQPDAVPAAGARVFVRARTGIVPLLESATALGRAPAAGRPAG
jgi:iron(III) transport system ATP-binding protein